MTTVAWDGKTLATDSQMTSGNLKGKSAKIIRLGNGGLFACAGDFLKARAAAAAIDGAGSPPDSDEVVYGLYIDCKGRPWSCEGKPFGLIPLKAPCGVGSGRDFALGAMASGKSAPEAVKIAARFDCFTSGAVQTASIKKPVRR